MATLHKKTIFELLQMSGLPCAYSHFKRAIEPPYVVYIGNGQDTFEADNRIYYGQNTYQIEYYYTEKNETNESTIESLLTGDGWIYSKSEDIYIEDLNCFVIYYYI